MVSKPNSVEKAKSQSSSFKTILKMGLTRNAPWPEDNTDDFLDLVRIVMCYQLKSAKNHSTSTN